MHRTNLLRALAFSLVVLVALWAAGDELMMRAGGSVAPTAAAQAQRGAQTQRGARDPRLPADWDEATYLALNPDVAVAVAAGSFASGAAHYLAAGQAEGRLYKRPLPATPTPTPYPTPRVDLRPYLHEQGGASVVVENTRGDVGMAVNEAGARLGAGAGKIVVRGGGSIKTQIVSRHDLEFREGVYTCDTETPWEGCILLKDGVKAEGFGATIMEPVYAMTDPKFPGSRFNPALTVFQSFNSAKSNEAASSRITVKGFRIVGRNPSNDGGVRQSISFGNCTGCAAIANRLEGVSSIGIQFGGSAARGNHASDGVATGNTIVASVAAGIAVVNASDVRVYGNTILKPGRLNGPGGVSGIDIETNNVDDWCENIKIYNNEINYEGSALKYGAGSGILAQNVYHSRRAGGLLIANNNITGGAPTAENQSLSNGIYFTNEFPGGLVVNNRIRTAKQHGLLLYASRGATFQDLELDSCGGGGNPAVRIVGGGDNRFIRLNIFTPRGVQVNTWATIWETQGTSGNIFEGNSVGVEKR